jgi:phage head maturation protease
MKTLLSVASMMPYLPTEVKDAINHVAKESGNKTDSLELHRHSHSEKAAVNGLDPKSRRALKYVSYRTQDRDDEIVIPEMINLTEFKKYGHVLVNHNYSLLPVGSDVDISADDYGIKALTEYADTGVGTLANVVWALVSQGHLKSSSIGFVPTSFTKPGARDWDHVANQLQSSWKEFDKGRAEKSISRIITGGVLLEHSDVSVPCNADAELISVCKAMHIEGAVAKQLGWEMKDGILVNKAVTPDPVPCACDECGFVADAVVGSRCPECKTGSMKAKGKEKAIEIRTNSDKVFVKGKIKKGMGPLSDNELRDALRKLVGSPTATAVQALVGEAYVTEIYEDYFLFTKNGLSNSKEELYFSQGFEVADDGEVTLVGEPEAVKRRVVYEPAQKTLPLPCTCDECGAEAECAPGSACQEPDCEGTMVADKGKKGGPGSGNFGHSGRPGERGGSGEGGGSGGSLNQKQENAIDKLREKHGNDYRVEPDKSGLDQRHHIFFKDPKWPNGEQHYFVATSGTFWKAHGKSADHFEPEIKVVRPAPSVKVLFVPPSGSEIAQRVGEAVEKALNRRTGKIM